MNSVGSQNLCAKHKFLKQTFNQFRLHVVTFDKTRNVSTRKDEIDQSNTNIFQYIG